jgi:hypothetical protein
MAKMRGHIGVGGRCHVEGHGQHCELGRETMDDRMERAREKRQWLREVWSGEPGLDPSNDGPALNANASTPEAFPNPKEVRRVD